MKEGQFKKMDEAILAAAKKIKACQVPADILWGFSRAVAQKIHQKEAARLRARKALPMLGLRILVPVFAVFLLFFTPLFRGYLPLGSSNSNLFTASAVSEMADEMSALKAVGAWNDEDDKTVVSDEAVLSELESA